jgi:hypothetical protein
LVTGRPPFGGDGRDVRSIMWRAVSEPPPRPDCPELPGLADAIVQAMAKEPEERFDDAAEFARALRALIPEGAPPLPMPDLSATTSMRTRTVSKSTTSTSSTSFTDPAHETTSGRRGRRRSTDTGSIPDDTADHTSAHTYDRAAAHTSDRTSDRTSDTSTFRRRHSSDETMVRPDRADPMDRPRPTASAAAAAAAAAASLRSERSDLGDSRESGEDTESHTALRRARKPLILIAAIALIGGGAWALLASRDSSANTDNATSTNRSPLAVSKSASPVELPTGPTASVTSTAKHNTAPVSRGGVTASATGQSAATPSASSAASGPLLGLPGSFHVLQNSLTGKCLTQPGGGSSTTLTSCAINKTEGWQYSLSLSGILAAGDYELVNEQTGQCLTAGSNGQVNAQTCDGGSAQLWSKTNGAGSSKEFQNAGDGQCLRAAQAVVSYGPCSTSDSADLWNEDGTE